MLENLEGKIFSAQKLIEEFGSPVIRLKNYAGFVAGDYRIMAERQEDNSYKIVDVYGFTSDSPIKPE